MQRRRQIIVLAKTSQSIDLEYGMFKIEAGRTYLDDGTTVFDVYVHAGLQDGSFEIVERRPDTITVTHPHV